MSLGGAFRQGMKQGKMTRDQEERLMEKKARRANSARMAEMRKNIAMTKAAAARETAASKVQVEKEKTARVEKRLKLEQARERNFKIISSRGTI